MERYEVVAQIKVGYADNVEDIINDIVQLLAYHDILCPEDKFKAAVVGDCVVVICSYSQGKAC
jgi:hypothetical protein